jgi:SAM-dependent methyltransferase
VISIAAKIVSVTITPTLFALLLYKKTSGGRDATTTTTKVSSKLEYPDCPLCHSVKRNIVFRLQHPYAVAQCDDCRLYYLYPRLTAPAAEEIYRDTSYYEGGCSGYSDAGYAFQEPSLRATFRHLLSNLAQRELTGGRLLEVGCGAGYLLDEAKCYFDQRFGTEFSPEIAATARIACDEVFVGGVEAVPPDLTFNCIVATQVIEHVYDPVSFVEQLARHIVRGGHIVLATPDIGGVLRKIMGRRWPSFKTPEHVVYFSFKTLSGLLSRAGFANVRRLPYPHAFPLGVLAAKFRLNLPRSLARVRIWVPATTIAAYGTVR